MASAPSPSFTISARVTTVSDVAKIFRAVLSRESSSRISSYFPLAPCNSITIAFTESTMPLSSSGLLLLSSNSPTRLSRPDPMCFEWIIANIESADIPIFAAVDWTIFSAKSMFASISSSVKLPCAAATDMESLKSFLNFSSNLVALICRASSSVFTTLVIGVFTLRLTLLPPSHVTLVRVFSPGRVTS